MIIMIITEKAEEHAEIDTNRTSEKAEIGTE